MKRGEVWWVDFEPSIGSEIRKTRPAIIISNNSANRNLSRVVVIPLSSNVTRQYPAEAIIFISGKNAKAMADQITVVDKQRLSKQMGEISKNDMLKVEEVILTHLGLPK